MEEWTIITLIILAISIMTLIYEYYCYKTNKKSRMSANPTVISFLLMVILMVLALIKTDVDLFGPIWPNLIRLILVTLILFITLLAAHFSCKRLDIE